MYQTLTALALAGAFALSATPPDPVPLYDDLGTLHHPVTTEIPKAQAYFDQGLRLVYAFNHAEAIRSFTYAAELDPECAMCWWGVALARGPNINVAMDSASAVEAHRAIEKARAAASRVTARERHYIEALATRYRPVPQPGDRASLDSAYAAAMAELSARYPEDDDAAILHAEAMMLLGPWDYWTEEKVAKPHGSAALAALEPVLERSPEHPGACHFFIHAVEAAYPERAVPCAERLPDLMPGAGHLVHMPAHVYIRVGRYADAIDRNEHALHADAEHLADMAPDGVYRLAIHPHNGHFLSVAATMIGRSAQAIESAELTRSKVDTGAMLEPGFGALQHYYALPLLTRVRFGRWDEILAAPEPPFDAPYLKAVRRYARALAYVRTGDPSAARSELAELEVLRGDPRLDGVTIWEINDVATLLDIAIAAVEGEIAAAAEDYDRAVRHLERGVRIEDGLTYDEPPPWHLPVRHQLGAVLLAAGRPAQAERVYREDLDRHPENGWSLYGLAEALQAQGRGAEARDVRERFEKVWATADVTLSASRY